jgi:hypothetical protein
MVGAVRFELTTSCTRNKRASRATLRPDEEHPSCWLNGPNASEKFWAGIALRQFADAIIEVPIRAGGIGHDKGGAGCGIGAQVEPICREQVGRILDHIADVADSVPGH